jgi:hypothetical protein
MSQLTDFNAAAYSEAKGIIGTRSLVIGTGDPVDVVNGEARYNRASELNGFQKSNSLRVVCDVAEFTASYTSPVLSYNGKLCTVDSEQWRISDTEEGDSYIIISLIGEDEVS